MRYLIMQPYLSYRGAETMSIGLTRELIKRGETASILGLYLDRQDTVGVRFILPPKKVQKIFMSSKLMVWTFGAPYLIFLILKNIRNFDILVPYNLPTSWFAQFFGKLFNKPVIWMAQGEIGAGMANKIIVPSNYLAKKILKRYGKKSSVIHNPIAKISGNIKDLPKEVLDLRKNNKFVFLQVGAINSQKRQMEMLEVFEKVLKVEPKCALIFVGEGDISNLKLENKVFLAGYVPKNKLGGYYQICDLNLLPSTNETFGGTPLEALTFGKNSLITTDSGVKEAISEFAIVSKPSKSEIFKNLLKYIKNKKHFDNLALKNKNRIIKDLTWENYTDSFLKEVDLDPIETYKESYYDSHYKTAPIDLLNERVVRLNRALNFINPKKGEKILDLGVGLGDLALEMAKRGAKVWGIDYSDSAIKLAKKKCGNKVKLQKMDAQKLDFTDNFFDKVVSIDVFEHIHQHKLEIALAEVRRVSKNNALLVVETSPNTYFWYPIMFLGKLVFNMKELKSEKYHINLFNYFRLKNTLQSVSKSVKVSLHNDGKNFLSSRVIGSNLDGQSKSKKVIYQILKFIDNVTDNRFFERNIFFGHDLWAVAKIKK